jgi:hypothetical protein
MIWLINCLLYGVCAGVMAAGSPSFVFLSRKTILNPFPRIASRILGKWRFQEEKEARQMIGPGVWVKREGRERQTTKKYRSSSRRRRRQRRRCRRRRRRRRRRFSFPRCELNSFRHFVKTCARLSQLASSSSSSSSSPPRNII